MSLRGDWSVCALTFILTLTCTHFGFNALRPVSRSLAIVAAWLPGWRSNNNIPIMTAESPFLASKKTSARLPLGCEIGKRKVLPEKVYQKKGCPKVEKIQVPKCVPISERAPFLI